MSVTTFDALPSRTPLSKRRTALRTDPYWGSLWRAGSTESWWSRNDAARLIKSGAMQSVPAWLRVRKSDAWARIEGHHGREKALRVLAALDQWRTMTAEQAEAMTDVTGVDLGGVNPWLSTLWAADLIDFAVVSQVLATGWGSTPARLLRPARAGTATERFQDMLTWPEWVSVTSGYGLEQDRQFDRHNILATELGLRAAEFANVGMVLGEKLSNMEMLAYTGWGKEAPSNLATAADLTLVRTDGARIAVEVTASKVGGWIQSKVDKHCEVLSRNPMNESGLAVVFVVAPHQDAPAHEVTSTLRTLKKAIQQGVRNYPGTALSPTAERIGIASWAHWFPGANEVVKDFRTLPVERPTARGYLMGGKEDDVWETAHMLDPTDLPFAPKDPGAATAIVRNASGLRGVPQFLCGDDRPELWKTSMRDVGVEGIETGPGRAGAAGTAKTPPRLQF